MMRDLDFCMLTTRDAAGFLACDRCRTRVDDIAKKRELWIDDLERWFENGLDESIVLIKVTPSVFAH